MARSSVATSRGATRWTASSLMPLEAVGQELRRRQHVAQLMVDLADREPELGEAPLLAQLVRERRLHLRERALGEADLVGAVASAR